MKRLVALWLCLLLTVCLYACEETETQDRRKIFLQNTSLTEEQTALLKTKTVILDPGHGFEDPGCEYPQNGIIEKELTRVLAQKIGACLEKSGITVLYTHDGETFMSMAALNAFAETANYNLRDYLETLVYGYSGRTGEEAASTVEAFLDGINEDVVFDTFERAHYANLLAVETPADLFVSVHINASATNNRAKGFDLFVCSDTPHEEQSLCLMGALEASLLHSFPDARCGTRACSWDNAYVVTKYADMPALLLESGFASNAEDARNLTDAAWQDEFAKAVADGVRLYLLGL